MINKRTVFVLGAGASKPYGFPSGMELLDQIYHFISRPSFDSFGKALPMEKHLKLFIDSGFSLEEIHEFRHDLKASQKRSIDAFLEHRTEYKELGKCLMLYWLLRDEIDEMIVGDWYQYIWEKMNTSFESFAANQISFITFNYDRSLEQYFLNCMQALYNKKKERCIEQLLRIPIVHLHGQLGSIFDESRDDYTGFGTQIDDPKRLRQVAESIKIIHDTFDNDSFEDANQLMRQAERVIILGFGYAETNVNRLNLKYMTGEKIMGSCFKMTRLECESLMNKYPTIWVPTDGVEYESLEFLREYIAIE